MYRIIEHLLNDIQRSDFRLWQNSLATEAYSTLEVSNASGDDEVKVVTKLCETLNDKSNGQMRLYAKKIHGSRSMVKFTNGDNALVTREMADMVVISLVTTDNKIVFEKLAFIQNKKEHGAGKWNIEQSQLYLLHNLPTFDGVSGIFRHEKSIALPSIQGRLGNYGLFNAPCNMVFANARIIAALQRGTMVSFDDINKSTAISNTPNIPFWGCYEDFLHNDLHYLFKHGYGYFLSSSNGIPVLGDCSITLNMHQFMRNWTQFNIGEVIIFNGKTRCKALTDLSRAYKKAAGFKELYKYDFDNINENEQGYQWAIDDTDAAVMVLHYRI